jgi:TM2 domain-containing membrane protein YozV
MRISSTLLAMAFLLVSAGKVSATGVARTYSVEDYFRANSLAMTRNFSNEEILRQQDEIDLSTNIYEYNTKSPAKAFLLSLAIPGAGEFYNEQRLKAGVFLAVDALLWTGYIVYHTKGSNREKEYKAYANTHYSWENYLIWWADLPDENKDDYSHRMPVDDNNVPIFNHEYYENIGKYDQFQVGWPDGLNHPFIPGDSVYSETYMPPERATYLDMRQQANDYFSNATTAVMVSIANHIVSAFDAAIGAKRYNKGVKQYSLDLKTKNIDGKTTPFLTLTAKF